MARRQLTLDEREIAALKQAADQTTDLGEVKRLQAIRLYGTGQPVADIADIVDTSIASIYRWAGWFKQGGLAELQTKYEGNQNAAKLTRQQKADLRQKLHQYRPADVLSPDIRVSRGEFWTVSDLRVAVKQWYGVMYQSDTSCHQLFKECDFSLQRATGQYRSRGNQQTVADFEERLEKSDRLAAS